MKKVKKKKILYVLFVLFVLSVLFFKLTAKTVEAAWFDDSYSYRVKFTFTHNAAIATERAVTYTLDAAELITAGILQSDCDDIRFTDLNGKLLLHDLTSSCNNASATFEVIFPSIINGSNVAYVYYGNSAAINTEVSSGIFTALTPSGGDPSAQTAPTSNDEQGPSPVLVLHMDETSGATAQDGSPNNNDGTISGPVWKTEEYCVSNSCLSFDGTDDVVTVANSTSIDLNEGLAGGFTISTWFKPNTDGESAQGQILNKNNFNLSLNDEIAATGNMDLRATLTLATSPATIEIQDQVVRGKWYHVAVTYTDDADDEISIYLNGKLVGTSTDGVGSPSADTDALNIGGSGSFNFNGLIDEVKIYNFEKTAATIVGEYNRTAANKNISASFGSPDLSKNLGSGLVSYLKLDESSWTANCSTNTAADSSGSNSPAQSCPNTTGQTTPVIGKYGGAVSLDGTEDYLNITDSNLTSPNSITVSGWFNQTALTTNKALIAKWNYSTSGSWALQTHNSDNTRLRLFIADSVGDGGTNYVDTATGVWSTGWHHVAFTFDEYAPIGDNVKIYIDGTSQTLTYNGLINQVTLVNSTAGIRIGDFEGLGRYWNGQIDDVRIYNRSLSGSEISSLYTQAPAPSAYWKLDDNTGTSVTDSSGSGLTGTVNDTRIKWNTGKYGSAVNFSGSGDGETRYINFGSDILEMGSTTNFTISGWVMRTGAIPDTGAGVIYNILNSQVSGSSPGYFLGQYGTGELSMLISDGTDTYEEYFSDPFTTVGIWYYVTAIVDRSNATDYRLFLNGTEQTTSSFGTLASIGDITDPTTTAVTSGIIINSASISAPFIFDDLKFYNYKRTPKQIMEDMNAGHPTVGTPVGSYAGYWKLDEATGTTAYDNSVNANNLTLSAASWTLDGKYGGAWNGTGANPHLSRADDADFDFLSGEDFALSVWARSDSASNPGAAETLIDKQVATNNPGYRLYFNTSGFPVCEIDDDTTSFPEDSATGTIDYYDLTWHHFVCVRNISTDKLNLFIDGKLHAQDIDLSATGDLSNTDSLTIGAADTTAGGTDDFAGDIDELKIYRAALTASDVQLEYNRGSQTVLGFTGTTSSGVADNSQAREFCIPGDTSTCNVPLVWYKFDENTGTSTVDSSGNANTAGTLTSGPIWVAGKIGQGINFDGSNDYVTAGDINSLDFSDTDDFSISAWVYRETNGTEQWVLRNNKTSNTTSDGGFNLVTWNTTNDISFFISDGTDQFEINTDDDVLPNNTWTHIMVVFDQDSAANSTIYVNGVIKEDSEIGTIASIGAPADDGGGIDFFVGQGSSGNYFDGTIDDVKIYNYARSPAQVQWDYNRGDPTLWYKFDDCLGPTANDSAGNLLSGTITPGGSGNTAVGACSSGTSTEMWNDGTSGKHNSAIGFDATDDYITTTNTLAIDQNFGLLNGMTISGWIYPNSDGESDVGRIFTKNTNTFCRVDTDTGTTMDLQCSQDLTTDATLNVSAAITENTWNHIALTWTNDADDEIAIWVNGKLAGTSTDGVGDPSADTSNLIIGNDTTSGTATFDGLIDDFRIYNYELTAAQMKVLFNQDSAVRFGPLTGSP